MLRTRWLQKPPNGVRVNLGSPITQGLKAAWLFNEGGGVPVDLLQGYRASLSGSIWGTGRSGIIHDTTTDKTTLASDSRLILPTAAGFTYVIGHRKRDTTARASFCIGIDRSSANFVSRATVSLPFSDNIVYWDYGGVTAGTSRLSVSSVGLNLTTTSVWTFTTGGRGMEIWQNGRKLASNTGNSTRTADTNPLTLGKGDDAANFSDLVDYTFLYVFHRQLGEVEIEQLSRYPYSICQVSFPIALQGAGIQFPTDLIAASDTAQTVVSEATPELSIIDSITALDSLALALTDTASLTAETHKPDVSDSIAVGIAELSSLFDAFVVSASDALALNLSEAVPPEWFTENPALLTLTWQEYIRSAGGASDALVIIWNEQRDSEDALLFQWVEISQEIDTLTLLWREMPPVYTLQTGTSRVLFPSRRLLVT